MGNLRTAAFGKLTPIQIAIDAQGRIGDAEAVVIVTVSKDGLVEVGWSDCSSLQVVGALQVAMTQVITEMREAV